MTAYLVSLPRDVKQATKTWNKVALQRCLVKYLEMVHNQPEKAKWLEDVRLTIVEAIDKCNKLEKVERYKKLYFNILPKVRKNITILDRQFKGDVLKTSLKDYIQDGIYIQTSAFIDELETIKVAVDKLMQQVHPGSSNIVKGVTPHAAWVEYSEHHAKWVRVMQYEAIDEMNAKAKAKGKTKAKGS